MDFAKEIAELREKINRKENQIDVAKSELCHREILNELSLKRDQVRHLKKELQAANSKTFVLNRELETNKSLLKESEFNLKLALKKAATLEEKLKEMNDSYLNLKLKEDLRLSEMQILNDNIQKISHDNHQLIRENDELKDRLKYSRAFQDELEERQTKINSVIAKLKENTENLEKEQSKVKGFENKIKDVEEIRNLTQVLVLENEKLKKENTEMENALIEISTKYEMLHKLGKAPKYADPYQKNITARIKSLQWEHHHKKLQEKNLNNEKIINTLSTTLQNERDANAQLIAQNLDYESRIEQLEKLLKNVPEVKKETDLIQLE